MDVETEKSILVLLTNRFNKWWNNQNVFVPEFRRRDFKYLVKKLEEPKAITLIGPRQVGKTTVVMQIIRELIEQKKVPPKRIFYVQFDDVELRVLSKNNLLLDVLSIYQKYVLLEDLNLVNSEVYLFFDEVQRVDDWAEHVKALLAVNSNIRVLATGSAGFSISQKSKETLPGRQELFAMFPLKFIDAVALYCSKNACSLNANLLSVAGYELRAGFEAALAKKSFKEFFESCKKKYLDFAPNEAEMNAAITRYFSKGGYPEIVITDDPSSCQKLLKSYANDVIVKDLMPWFRIRDFPTAEKLLFLLASLSGAQMNVTELLKRLPGANAQTINKYISYFESLSIMGKVPVYTGSKLGSSKHPKTYFLDAGLRNAILGVIDAPIQDIEKGHLAETVAYDHLLRLAYKLNSSSRASISCVNQKKGEVDFVVELPRYAMKLPIEIKFRKNTANLKGFYEFTGTRMGIIITENQLDLKGNVLFLPMWMFLIMC
ncbi:ATP-binding protein [Candidatus Micrarchaeota archaeon]|nr:ATP-binding protein [Candidatus Micrarchaeota archaeon]